MIIEIVLAVIFTALVVQYLRAEHALTIWLRKHQRWPL